jgi:hypothetical protein
MSLNIPKLFIEYSKSHPALIRQRKDFIHYLGGGMAIKLFLRAQKISPNVRTKTTSDFDFVFAVPNKLSNSEMKLKFNAMDRMMSRHVNGFQRWLLEKHKVPAIVTKEDLVPPVRYNPISKKIVYRVIQYKIQVVGMKPEGLVDTTLAYIPGVRRYQLLDKYTAKFGMPIQRLKYMYKGVLTLLASSFSSFAIKDPSLGSRNPLTGNRKEKGLKNTARIANLMRAQSRASTAAQKLVKHIKSGNVQQAYKEADRVLKNLATSIKR